MQALHAFIDLGLIPILASATLDRPPGYDMPGFPLEILHEGARFFCRFRLSFGGLWS